MDFAVLVDHRGIIKGMERGTKPWTLPENAKKWNMWVMIIAIIVNTPEIVSKGLEKHWKSDEESR